MKYLLTVLLLLSPTAAFAEPAALPKEAQELTAKLSAVKTYEADFTMETKEDDGKLVKLEGKISFKSPNMRRLEIKQDDTQELPQMVISDGTYEWHYDPNTNPDTQESPQVLRSSVPAELPGPHRPFGEIQSGSLRFVEKRGSGATAVLRFEGAPSPVLAQSSPVPIKLIRLDVGEQDGFLRDLFLLDEKGQEVLAQHYTSIRINPDLPASDFVFTPPEGVPVKDLSAEAQKE